MGEGSKIEWTDHTFNPWVGCMKVSPGCKNCYASVNTFTRTQRSRGRELWGPASTTERHVTSDAKWREPIRWNAAAEAAAVRARVFCASMADVFEDHPMLPPIRERLWPLMEATPWLDWQVLTKRPENVLDMAPAAWRTEWPAHVWIGTSVEDQERADLRIPALLAIPARIRFLSCEPLLGPVDLTRIGEWRGEPLSCLEEIVGYVERPRVQWVIVGGESGPGARPFDVRWARALVSQCRASGVPVFVKQMGARCGYRSEDGVPLPGADCETLFTDGDGWFLYGLRDRKGGDWSEWPYDLRVRQMPDRSPIEAP